MRFSLTGEYYTLQDIKEKHGYIAQDYDQELKGKTWLMKITNKQIETTVAINCPTVRPSL